MFNAQLIPEDTELITDIIFPDVGDNQVFIPANAIRHQRNVEGKIIKLFYAITVFIFCHLKASGCQLSIILPEICNHTLLISMQGKHIMANVHMYVHTYVHITVSKYVRIWFKI